MFPATRLRRLRKTGRLRGLVRETELSVDHLVLPMFVVAGGARRTPIATMPGVDHLSIDGAVEEAAAAAALGIPAVLLFGLPADKDEQGSGAWDDEGVIQLATRAIKAAHPDLLVITDLCLCEYTSHGHCGVLRPDGVVDNDATLDLLARTAVSQAAAGADAIAPSDMMDGRVGALRTALDDQGLSETPIIAYSAKFASAFYGPFREAADSTPQVGDRRGYQMDPANAREALREVALDVAEGADVVMVKPALPYLDVIRRIRDSHRSPDRRLQRQRRVRHDQGRRRPGSPRGAARRARGADRHPPRRRRHRDHLPRQGRRQMASVKVRSRRGGSAVPLDEADKRLLNLMQGSFELCERPFEKVAALAGLSEDDVMARVQRLLDKRIIREITPIFDTRALGYSSMLVAAKVDAANPHRAAGIINSHPGVTHNYLRNHEFNLWFTIAVEPDSRLGLPGTLEALQRETGAESIRQLPTLKLFKIRMDLEMEQGTDALSTAGEAVEPIELEPIEVTDEDVATIRATQGPMAVLREPFAPAAERLGVSQAAVLERLASLRERGGLRRVAAILFHRRAGFSANGMGVWKVPEDEVLETGKRMAAFRGVSHCYQRPTYADWPYSVFTMAHGRSKEECDAILSSIADATGIHERATLYSSTEFKKVRMIYFTDSFARWEEARL